MPGGRVAVVGAVAAARLVDGALAAAAALGLGRRPRARGLHSFTSQLNLSRV